MIKLAKILILLMVASAGYAQHSYHQLYQAYLERDMRVWEEHIISTNWDSLDVRAREELLNYEYGFTAYIIGEERADAADFLTRYAEHLEAMKGLLPAARYEAYMASLYTYKMALEKTGWLSRAKNLFRHIKRAMELNSEDALVVSVMGNVEFYNPFGSKKKALAYFQQADSLYHIQCEEYEQWNHRFVEMNIEMCLDKINK